MSLLTRYDKNIMTALSSEEAIPKVIFSHIYNRGIEKLDIFKDREDYETFVSYLTEYLSTPVDPESTKKDFVVNGKIYRGVPHQPKNFFNKVELVAYGLNPRHFHLILEQKTPGSTESFIRSLSTRYSIYFNKKYQRSGTLFEGPYKSVSLEDAPSLLLLTQHIHKTCEYSSLPEYLGARNTVWVKPKTSPSFLENRGGSYQNFVEKYTPDAEEKKLLQKVVIENESSNPVRHQQKEKVIVHTTILPEPVSHPAPAGLFIASFLFFVLTGLGLRNIRVSANLTQPPNMAATEVLSESDEAQESTKPVNKQVIIKINDDSESVNIRLGPSTQSEIVGKALAGETYEYIAKDAEWYKVRLSDGSIGYISSDYAQIEEN